MGGSFPWAKKSASKKKSVRISKAGVYLKPCHVEVAHAAVKDKQNSYYAIKFENIRKRRGKKRAYVAIARKILVAICHMLSTGEVFNPRDLADVETPVKQRVKYISNNFQQSVKQLKSIGLSIDQILEMIKSTTLEPEIPTS